MSLIPTSTFFGKIDVSFYYAHCITIQEGGTTIDLMSAEVTVQERAKNPQDLDNRLTFCEGEARYPWFYILFIEQLDSARLRVLGHWVWGYAEAVRHRLGRKGNE